MYDIEQEKCGLQGDIGRIIKTMRWTYFCKHPSQYNIQLVKEYYANLVDIPNKRLEMVVRGTKVVYSKETINMVLGFNNVCVTYQHLLETYDEGD